jgi:hypothetical protein
VRKTHWPDVSGVGPKLETVSGLKFGSSSKIAELSKPNGGLGTSARAARREVCHDPRPRSILAAATTAARPCNASRCRPTGRRSRALIRTLEGGDHEYIR